MLSIFLRIFEIVHGKKKAIVDEWILIAFAIAIAALIIISVLSAIESAVVE